MFCVIVIFCQYYLIKPVLECVLCCVTFVYYLVPALHNVMIFSVCDWSAKASHVALLLHGTMLNSRTCLMQQYFLARPTWIHSELKLRSHAQQTKILTLRMCQNLFQELIQELSGQWFNCKIVCILAGKVSLKQKLRLERICSFLWSLKTLMKGTEDTLAWAIHPSHASVALPCGFTFSKIKGNCQVWHQSAGRQFGY